MTKNRTPTPVYLDPGMHPGLEVKGLIRVSSVQSELKYAPYEYQAELSDSGSSAK